MDGVWQPFESSRKASAVRFEMLGNRFMRIRDRSRERNGGDRVYIVIDLWSRKILDDQTLIVPRPNGHGASKGDQL